MSSLFKKLIRSPKRKWTRFWRKRHEREELRFATLDAARIADMSDKSVLFVDAGSNVGQGFRWFSSRFTSANVTFHLFEPNPNCASYLEEAISGIQQPVKLHMSGIGAEAGELPFYGLEEHEGGELSQGGSTLKSHNSARYQASEERAIIVPVIDFGAYLQEQSENFDVIVVKMDVEGAEIQVLETLIKSGRHCLIDTLYVEYHSQYLAKDIRLQVRQQEKSLTRRLQDDGVKVRIWH